MKDARVFSAIRLARLSFDHNNVILTKGRRGLLIVSAYDYCRARERHSLHDDPNIREH